MSVYKHKNGRWYCRFQIRGKRYHQAVPEATDKKSAENAEIKIKAELLSGRYDLVENKKERTFFQVCDKFEEYAKNNRKNYDKDKGMIKKLKNYYGDKLLSDFNPFVVESYRSKRKKEGMKPATINKEIGVLRRIFSIAMDNKWTDHNPSVQRFIKPLAVANSNKKILTKDEEQALLNACCGDSAYLKPIILCALHTGMRRSEILNLKWKNINLEKSLITILVQKNRKKSFIPISSTLKQELNNIWQNRKNDYVFINPTTDKPYINIRKTYNKVLNAANITDFTFHCLRHTACTRMFELGISVDVVKEIMRHSDISITLEVYNHIHQERKIEAIQKLENYCK